MAEMTDLSLLSRIIDSNSEIERKKMKLTSRYYLIILLFFAFLIGIGTAPAFAVNPQNDQATNDMLTTYIKYRLMKDNLLVNNNIQVTVANGVIKLQGTVPTLAAKKKAEDDAHKVEESYAIVNELSITKSGLTDEEIAKKVEQQIYNHVFYSIFDWVTVEVNNGVVTLKGWVHLPWGDRQFVSEAEKVPGVLEVKNEIKHELGSDELRLQAARLIYNDPRFEYYAYNQNPPIHIIVTGSTLILEGQVKTESDKGWAESLLLFNTNAGTIQNDLTVNPNLTY